MNGSASFAVGPPDDPDRYVLGEARGLGGESIVYRAHRGEREVAVKILREDHRGGLDQLADRWISQVELLRTLRHPAVVRPIEAFVGTSLHRVGREPVGRSLCLVMEWIEGRELDRVVRARQGDIDNAEVLSLLEALRPVADALDLMHRGERTDGEPVVHGDIKPSNVLLRSSGEAVLVDFGLASAMARRPTGGTPNYRAPESARVGNSPSTDIYGFAAVIAAILNAGSAPTVGRDAVLPIAVQAGLSAEPSERPDLLVPWLDALITERRSDAGLGGADKRGASVGHGQRSFSAAILALAIGAIGLAWVGRSELVVHEVELSVVQPGTFCDPDEWRVAAAQTFPIRWDDPDGDCVHTVYELNGTGRDPFVADADIRQAVDDDLNEQAGAVLWQLIRGTRRHDPVLGRAACEPEVWRAAALRWSELDNPRNVRWDDPDGDCLTARYELLVGTDPLSADTDGDGYLDSLDPHETNGLIPPQHRQLGLVLRRSQLSSAHDLTAADTRERFAALKERLGVD